MIQKMFEKMLLKAFNSFNEQIGDYLVMNTEIIKKHTEELKKIKEALERPSGLMTMNGMDTIMGSYNTKEETLELLEDTLKKDYFTQEFLNKNASNTRTLYVICKDTMTKHLYKKGNEKQTKDIYGKTYLFID